MGKGITTNPGVALSGLIAMAMVGILFIGGGMALNGLVSNSWFRVITGLGFLAGFSWIAWEAGEVVRKALKHSAGSGRSGGASPASPVDQAR
jgi:hypothetical protein